MKRDLQGLTVLITGASSGIGKAIALEYAARGATVAALARRADRLADLADCIHQRGGACLPLEGDVTVDGSLEIAVTKTLEAYGRIDVAIANAGFGVSGEFLELGLEDYRRQFETNVFGVMRTVTATIPALEASRGRLALIGSVSSYVTVRGTTAYAMSKHAVRSLAEGLAFELAERGISVTLVAPGYVESEIRHVDNKGHRHDRARDPLPSWLVMKSEVAARQIVRAVQARRSEIVITVHGKIVVAIRNHLAWLYRFAGYRMPSFSRKPKAGN